MGQKPLLKETRALKISVTSKQLPVLILLLLLIVPLADNTLAENFSQHEVRAAYLFNFGSFIRWNNQQSPSSSHFQYCVTDLYSPVSLALKVLLKGERVKGKPVKVRLVEYDSTLAGCQILYLEGIKPGAPAFLFHAEVTQGLLTVSDTEEFIEQGGMVALIAKDKKIFPVIHLQRLQKAGLQASSKLLRFSRVAPNP